MTSPLFAIDSSVYIFRSYFALQPNWRSADGMPTEAVYGFAAFLIRLLEREKPAYIAAAFDESLGSGFRHQLYPLYKANRALPDENLEYQFVACKRIAHTLGIGCFGCQQYEADDYLAACVGAAESGQPVYVLSRDKDLAQLLGKNVRIWDYGYGEPISRERFMAEKHLEPELVPDMLALTGDASDNIPGVPGVGGKTATAILATLGPIENWIGDLDRLVGVPVRGSEKLAAKIEPYLEQLMLARQLTALRGDIPGISTVAQMRWRGIDRDGAEAVFIHYGLSGLLGRLRKIADQ